jgi:hypothetical protein
VHAQRVDQDRSLKRTTAVLREQRIEVYGMKPGSVPVASSTIRHVHRRCFESKMLRADPPWDWTLNQPPATLLPVAQLAVLTRTMNTWPCDSVFSVPQDRVAASAVGATWTIASAQTIASDVPAARPIEFKTAT